MIATKTLVKQRVEVFVCMSLDGFIADAKHGLSHLDAYSQNTPEQTGYVDLMRQADAVLIGHNTYKVVAAFEPWPYEHKPVYVLSHTQGVCPKATQTFNDTIDKVLDALALLNHRHIYIDGGHTVSQALNAHRVTDMTLFVLPLILGNGIALFQSPLSSSTWHLQSSEVLADGLVKMVYKKT